MEKRRHFVPFNVHILYTWAIQCLSEKTKETRGYSYSLCNIKHFKQLSRLLLFFFFSFFSPPFFFLFFFFFFFVCSLFFSSPFGAKMDYLCQILVKNIISGKRIKCAYIMKYRAVFLLKHQLRTMTCRPPVSILQHTQSAVLRFVYQNQVTAQTQGHKQSACCMTRDTNTGTVFGSEMKILF